MPLPQVGQIELLPLIKQLSLLFLRPLLVFEGSCHVALVFPLFDRGSLVVLLLTSCQAYLQLG